MGVALAAMGAVKWRAAGGGLAARMCPAWRSWLFAMAVLAGCCGTPAQAQPAVVAEALIPEDPATLGYQVDNTPLKYEERSLGNNIDLRNERWLDGRYRIANLIADEKGDYSRDRAKKVVLLDAKTGEVKPTRYEGDIRCLSTDRFLTTITAG